MTDRDRPTDRPTDHELIDWLQGIVDRDGVDPVDPDAPVRIELLPRPAWACLQVETVSGHSVNLPLDPEPIEHPARQGRPSGSSTLSAAELIA